MKLVRKLAQAFAIAALLFSALAPVGFAQEQAIPGTFTAVNTAPTVTLLDVYPDAASGEPVKNLAPGVMYYVRVSAGDANTLNDVRHITVTFFYDPSNPVGQPTFSFSNNPQTHAAFTWDKDGGSGLWRMVEQVVMPGQLPSTWSIDPGRCLQPGMDSTSGDWVFAITPGKVATDSVGDADWDLYVGISDGANTYVDMYSRDKEMLWYGEISTDVDAKADFRTVQPGSGFADNTNEVGSITVKYISNGNYDQRVKSDATWKGDVYKANYDDLGNTTQAQQFSLKALGSDTFASAVQVTTGGVSINSTGTQTPEAGNTVATNTLWLKVAPGFNVDTYSGNITYTIANR